MNMKSSPACLSDDSSSSFSTASLIKIKIESPNKPVNDINYPNINILTDKEVGQQVKMQVLLFFFIVII